MMKSGTIGLLLLGCLMACSKDSDPTSFDDWGIIVSEKAYAGDGVGEIVNQNTGSLIAFQVDSTYIQQYIDNQYFFKLYFTTHDSLTFVMLRYTRDFNYHSDADESQNKILYSILNQDTLEMMPSALSIQPRTEYNAFHTVTNLHTLTQGTFNGTVNHVPLIK